MGNVFESAVLLKNISSSSGICEDFENGSNHHLNAARQKHIMDFLCHYLDIIASTSSSDVGNKSTTTDNTDALSKVTNTLSPAMEKMSQSFHNVELPLLDVATAAASNKNARIQQCRQQCMVLAQDPILSNVVSRVYAVAVESTSSCKLAELKKSRMKNLYQEYHSLLIAKILHGLGTGLVPANEWRDRCSTHWESCRDLTFNSVKECAMEVIAKLT